MESDAHSRLKSGVLKWLSRAGVRIRAAEVVCPLSRFRFDVAGYIDALPRGRKSSRRAVVAPTSAASQAAPAAGDSATTFPAGDTTGPRPGELPIAEGLLRRTAAPRTVVVECKAFRSDFLRDTGETAELLRQRDDLTRQCDALERKILRAADPLAAAEAGWLFSELAPWDYTACRTGSYRKLADQLNAVHRSLHSRIKFELVARYRLADVLLIAAPRGVLERSELPRGWGLLEFDSPATEDDPRIVFADHAAPHAPLDRPSAPKFRSRLLRNIAVAASIAADRGTIASTNENGPRLIDAGRKETILTHKSA